MGLRITKQGTALGELALEEKEERKKESRMRKRDGRVERKVVKTRGREKKEERRFGEEDGGALL